MDRVTCMDRLTCSHCGSTKGLKDFFNSEVFSRALHRDNHGTRTSWTCPTSRWAHSRAPLEWLATCSRTSSGEHACPRHASPRTAAKPWSMPSHLAWQTLLHMGTWHSLLCPVAPWVPASFGRWSLKVDLGNHLQNPPALPWQSQLCVRPHAPNWLYAELMAFRWYVQHEVYTGLGTGFTLDGDLIAMSYRTANLTLATMPYIDEEFYHQYRWHSPIPQPEAYGQMLVTATSYPANLNEWTTPQTRHHTQTAHVTTETGYSNQTASHSSPRFQTEGTQPTNKWSSRTLFPRCVLLLGQPRFCVKLVRGISGYCRSSSEFSSGSCPFLLKHVWEEKSSSLSWTQNMNGNSRIFHEPASHRSAVDPTRERILEKGCVSLTLFGVTMERSWDSFMNVVHTWIELHAWID